MTVESQQTPQGVLPSDFVYGYATASYQIEGGAAEDGRLPSIWDDFCKVPGAIEGGDDGDVAIDSYHLYDQDVALLKSYGANAYRFSVSWSRVIPLGGRNDPVNEKGIEYYSKLIDLLLENGITPYVTIFHWDLPSELEKRYEGWITQDEIVKDFERYARLLFERFGDRVKNWITLNEPICVSLFNSKGAKPNWNYEKHMYPTAHSLILSHAVAVDAYRKDFKPTQKGRIGITLNSEWTEPMYDTPEAKWACQRAMDQALGWYADPIYLGHYPKSLLEEDGHLIPKFTEEEWKLVKGSADFFGLNFYSATFCSGKKVPENWLGGKVEHSKDDKDGKPLGNPGHLAWLKDTPWANRKLLNYINDRYLKPNGIPLLITEQGFCMKDEHKMSIEEACKDEQRVNYYRGYINGVVEAIQDGVDVRGYFAWSLADNFEWMEGYDSKFGCTYVDRANGNKRYPKDSSQFLKNYFAKAIKKE